MTSTSISISNTKEAIETGIIPGKFNETRKIFLFPLLEYIGTNKASHQWQISIKVLESTSIANIYNEISITDDMLKNTLPTSIRASISVEAGQKDGKIRDSIPTIIMCGKNIGKKNETNAITQAFRDALGLYNKQLKKVTNAAMANTKITKSNTEITKSNTENTKSNTKSNTENTKSNTENTKSNTKNTKSKITNTVKEIKILEPPPMLVKNIKDAPLSDQDFIDGVTVQRKLNGVHYIIYMTTTEEFIGKTTTEEFIGKTITKEFIGNKIIRYSRNGIHYPEESSPQISVEMEEFIKHMPNLSKYVSAENIKYYENAIPYFAGELYKHGLPLNKISGQARNTHVLTDTLLEYHIFDVFFPIAIAAGHNMISKYRQQILIDTFNSVNKLNSVKQIENFKVTSNDEMYKLFDKFINEKYEGAIARKDNAEYRYSINNYHSSNIVKIKPIFDDEFPIVGFTQGEKGKDKGALIWICGVLNLQFHAVPKQTYKVRYELYTRLSNDPKLFETYYKGKPLTIQYAELSSKGIPLQPKAIIIRDYE